VSDRLNRRKLGIRKYIMPSALALVRDELSNKNEDCAWISTKLLRLYFQSPAASELDDLLKSHREPVIKNAPYLCEHKRLSPDKAMTGKLLPMPMYNALLSMLQGERALLNQDSNSSAADKYNIEDIKISVSKNLICQECSSPHRFKLAEKLELLRAAKDLHGALATKKGDDVPVGYKEGDEPKAEEDSFVYVLSRQTATRFRKRVETVLRSASKVESGGVSDLAYAGLGAIDISAIAHHVVAADGTKKFAKSQAELGNPLDKHFNSNITCKYFGSVLSMCFVKCPRGSPHIF